MTPLVAVLPALVLAVTGAVIVVPRRKVIDDVGHLPMLEARGQFNELLTDFATSVRS